MTPPRELTVLTLNLWNRGDPWPARLEVLREGLRALDPDVIALQEVLRLDDLDQLGEVNAALGYHAAFGRDGDSYYLFGNAILSRWPIREAAVLPLPRCGTDENRCAVLAIVESPWGDLPVCTTHLNWRMDEGHVRVAQVKALTAWLASCVDPDALPLVLAGDFNAEPDADEMRYLRGATGLGGPCVHFVDCFAAAGDGSRGSTFAPRRNPYAAPTREPDRRIDYVLVRGPNARCEGEALDARVVLDAPRDGVWASDHFGVWARVGL